MPGETARQSSLTRASHDASGARSVEEVNGIQALKIVDNTGKWVVVFAIDIVTTQR